MTQRPELKSCGVILVQGDPPASFLLMKHPDRWDLPKGHIELGETEHECALREMEEETGIPRDSVTIEPDFCFKQEYLVTTERSGWEPRMKTLVIFLARVQEELGISVTEHGDFRWFAWRPPHQIQLRTIDPLLAAVEAHFDRDNKT